MKNILCFLYLLFLVPGLRAQVVFDASAADPNPTSQGWTPSEVVHGPAGNVGEVQIEGETAWQINDRLTPSSQDNPFYSQDVPAADLNTYFTEGWEFSFTFRVPETSPEDRFSGFAGFAIRAVDAPSGWNVPAGTVARVGFLIGSDSPGSFFLTPQPRNKVTFPTDGGFHTVKVVGEAESDLLEWFVDGVSQGISRVAEFTFNSGRSSSWVNFQAGSSAVLNGPVQWKAVSLSRPKVPTVVINSDDLTISDGGVASGDTFRGVPFTATVYNGLARFLFAGDLVLNEDDLVVGRGRSAISLTVSGEVVIPEGAVIDVSASAEAAGPGGGFAGEAVSGAEAGDGKKGGNSVSGGAGGGGGPVTGNWPNLVANAGKSGKTGNTGNSGTTGEDGGTGQPGRSGEGGYGAPNTGGASRATAGGGGSGGLGRRGSLSPGGGGAGGPGDVVGREPGRNGGNATTNGLAGENAGDGNPGASGEGGRVTRLTSRLTGGGGGASGQSGGGGGGGGGGGSGAGGGGGGGEGAAWQFPVSGVAGRSGGSGGAGGAGGHGGRGGAGGASGEGGHGGGALEIIAYGPLRFAGEFRALGGGGQAGSPGAAPTNTGKTNGSGGSDGSVVSGGGNGGKGSSGGNGGAGGSGGPGGRGGGGAGGTIRLVGSTVDSSGMTVNVGGGAGGEVGETGRVLVLSDTGDFGGEIVNENALVLEEYDGPRQLNPHLSSFASTPLIPDLVNGAEVAGRLNGLNAGLFPGLITEAPSNARAAVMRMDVGPAGYDDDFKGFDMLLFVNLTPTPLPQPVLGAGSPGYVSRFLDGGLASQEVFGGEGPGQLAQLEEYGIYATLIPEADSSVTFGYQPGESFVRQTSELANGGLVYLEDAGTRENGAIPAPTVHPDPVLMLPEAGPLVNFGFTGRVQVNIEPTEAETTGVGWYLEGRTPVYPGGFVAEELEPGQYLLKFARLAGWLPPRDQVITVQPGGTTMVEADYLEAPTMAVGEIAPQRVREGDVLGFYLAPGTQVRLVSGQTNGVVVVNPDGWFRYEPGELDRAPFELEFSGGGGTQRVTITPLKELPEEQTILALEPVAEVPASSGRDYTFIHTAEAAVGVNYREASACEEVTISGVTLVFEKEGDSQLYDLIHDRRNISALNLYADEIIVRDRLALQATHVTLYARRLVFEDVSEELAVIDTSAQNHTASDLGDPQAGGDITLQVQEIVSGPSASARFILGGADTTTDRPAGDSGRLVGSFDLNDFAEARGGSGAGSAGLSQPVEIHPAGVVPEGLAWIHPQAVRSVILYAKDIYYLGFMNAAGEWLRDYQGYLEDLTAIEGIPPMPDADLADLQLAEQYTDISAVVDRIDDRLDYFGNSAGWVPLLSFEANFNLTEGTIGRAMRAFYLAHWLSAAENTILDRQNAMRAAREALSDETDELKAEFPNVRDEIEELEDKAVEIDEMTRAVEEELRQVERRLEQKAEEIVSDRNNVPFWKTALRTSGSIMKVVPFYQPALGAVGGALEIGSRIDEQEPLDTVLQVTDLALQYQAANYDQQAQDIDDELNPPAPKSDKELERDELRGKANNMRTAAGGVAQAGGALKDYLASREVAADEVAAELQKIRASDPQFNGVIARLQELMDEKERFARRIASLEDRLREIPGIILKNRIAMITLGDSIDAGNTVLDPQALSVVKEMEARNKDRLRRYFYLLAKSFEYRLLEPYREEGFQVYDPVQVLDEIKEILIASQSDGSTATSGSAHHVLSPTGFESLRSVLEEELALLSERIIEGYESGDNREQTAPFRTFLNESELECINKPDMPAVLNLHKRGVYSAGEEAHRIADLWVTDVDFALTIGGERVALDDPRLDNLSSATIDLSFVHSGLTRLSRKGQTYFFNHFRNGDPDQNPIRWTAKVNLLSGEVIMVRPSLASDSLLSTLLDTANTGDTENQLKILNFSRPGANADIFVSALNLNPTFSGGLPPAGLGVEFTRIGLEAQLDYYFATAERLVDVRVIDSNGAALGILPRILFDDAEAPDELIFDDFGRRDALGMVSRSFREVDELKITIDEFYGSELASENAFPSGYRFSRWLDQGFNPISSVNEVTIANEGQKRIYAVYERVGDLEAPVVEAFRARESEGNFVTYEVEFSEDVVGVDVTDFAVAGQPPGLGIRRVSGSGKSRLVTVDPSRFPAGESRLVLSDDDSILDFTGNSLAGDGPGNGSREVAFTASGNFELRLSHLQVTAGDAAFLVEGFANRDYRVESSTTLNGDWSLVEEVTTNDFGEAEVTDEGAGTRRFYRVVELP